MKGSVIMEEKIQCQRDAFAILACKMLGKTVEETANVLSMDTFEVRYMYLLIEKGLIDFDDNKM